MDRQPLTTFVLLNLGLIDLLRSGEIKPVEGAARFYHAQNRLYVRSKLNNELCDEIMGRGAELPDLFDALSKSAARRQLTVELNRMRKLCFRLLAELE